ncbi:MAG: PA2778 family cysteine peptidase [Gammaproteobacteria bacterium]|nr:PA2778 family cysteine peptidase [Gammaproteobacteria bacterium]
MKASPPAGLPEQVELVDVPFFPQEAYQCGPAALATLLLDQGIPVEPAALVPEVYVPARQGSLQAEMLAAARARGLVAYSLRPELNAILREVAAGRPVLVLQNLGLSWLPYWHYAVIVGYDLARGEIVLRSGLHERHVNGFARFEHTWRRAGRWAFVVTTPDRLPATAQPLPWLQAAHALESTGQSEIAAEAYVTATRHWPQQAAGWFGLANAYYALGRYAEAEIALRSLLKREPDMAMAWNNLAHVLAARGCGAQARQAAVRALRLEPHDTRYRSTAEQMQEVTEGEGCFNGVGLD